MGLAVQIRMLPYQPQRPEDALHRVYHTLERLPTSLCQYRENSTEAANPILLGHSRIH